MSCEERFKFTQLCHYCICMVCHFSTDPRTSKEIFDFTVKAISPQVYIVSLLYLLLKRRFWHAKQIWQTILILNLLKLQIDLKRYAVPLGKNFLFSYEIVLWWQSSFCNNILSLYSLASFNFSFIIIRYNNSLA